MNSTPEIAVDQTRDGLLRVLGELCSKELAAARTYEDALGLLALKPYSDVIGRCYAAHSNMHMELGDRIARLGGEVPTEPVPWGEFASTLAEVPEMISGGVAIALLEQAEDSAFQRYLDASRGLDDENRLFLLERILPSESACHSALSNLKHQVVS